MHGLTNGISPGVGGPPGALIVTKQEHTASASHSHIDQMDQALITAHGSIDPGQYFIWSACQVRDKCHPSRNKAMDGNHVSMS